MVRRIEGTGRAEAKAITTMPFARPRKAQCGTRHGRQWRKLTEARGDSPSGHHSRKQRHGEQEESEAMLTETMADVVGADGSPVTCGAEDCGPREWKRSWSEGRDGNGVMFLFLKAERGGRCSHDAEHGRGAVVSASTGRGGWRLGKGADMWAQHVNDRGKGQRLPTPTGPAQQERREEGKGRRVGQGETGQRAESEGGKRE
jgi:hypothetical protein